MNNNIEVCLRPDTLQSSYLGLKNEILGVDVLTFNDGSVRVTLPNMSEKLEHRYCTIKAYIQSMDDVMIVAQIKDIIQRLSKSKKIINLVLTGTTYTRYDRVMLTDQTDSFGAKVFADVINDLKFDYVNIYDCHSQVMLDLIKNSVNIDQDVLVKDVLHKYGKLFTNFNIIAPDAGALKKLINADMIFDKVRDVTNGQITGMKIAFDESTNTKDYIVIDDICEGGRTFIELAKLFKSEKGQYDLSLYVTHGLFTNNAIPKLLDYYTNIYVKFMKETTFEQLTEEQKSKVHVSKFIKA